MAESCYYLGIALRVLFTSPVAGGERGSSKQKSTKSCLRSRMRQERLNGLALKSIESDVGNSLDYNELIDNFAERKVWRCPFV